MKLKKIVIDIDNTICEEKTTFERCLAKPIHGSISTINQLFDSGHQIIFYTARGWAEYNMTKDWLDKHGFKYHILMCGKPIYDIWIDDRAIQFTSWNKINDILCS